MLLVLVLLTTSVLKQREVPATVSSFYVSVPYTAMLGTSVDAVVLGCFLFCPLDCDNPIMVVDCAAVETGCMLETQVKVASKYLFYFFLVYVVLLCVLLLLPTTSVLKRKEVHTTVSFFSVSATTTAVSFGSIILLLLMLRSKGYAFVILVEVLLLLIVFLVGCAAAAAYACASYNISTEA